MRNLGVSLAWVLFIAACSPVATTSAPSAPGRAATAVTSNPTPSATAAAEPTPTAAPRPLSEVPVALGAGTFPITASLALVPGKIDDDLNGVVSRAIGRYLEGLDRFRATGAQRSQLPVSGAFGDAVYSGMRSSSDGVARAFALQSFHVDTFVTKPWRTRAVAEVTATIVDKAVDGSGRDQVETGRLRLVGDKLDVVDGWDDAAGRWFNGPSAMTADGLRDAVGWPISSLLGAESWAPGHPINLRPASGAETPYERARREYLQGLDQSRSASRTFADVTAAIERYETFAQIRDGLATVRIAGSAVTADSSGKTTRTSFEPRVIILIGNWIPEVVDEQMTGGAWLSGGDLALAERDQNFA